MVMAAFGSADDRKKALAGMRKMEKRIRAFIKARKQEEKAWG